MARFLLTVSSLPSAPKRQNVVFGEGSRADIMFIGEGRAPKKIVWDILCGCGGPASDRILAAAGWSREENILPILSNAARPVIVSQRDEIEACYPLLQKQIELIDPLLSSAWAVASKVLLKPDFRITKEGKLA